MMKDDRTSAQQRKDKISEMALSEANEDRRLNARLRNAQTVAGMQGGKGLDRESEIMKLIRTLSGELQYMNTPPDEVRKIATATVDSVMNGKDVPTPNPTSFTKGQRELDKDNGYMIYDGTKWTVDPNQDPA